MSEQRRVAENLPKAMKRCPNGLVCVGGCEGDECKRGAHQERPELPALIPYKTKQGVFYATETVDRLLLSAQSRIRELEKERDHISDENLRVNQMANRYQERAYEAEAERDQLRRIITSAQGDYPPIKATC